MVGYEGERWQRMMVEECKDGEQDREKRIADHDEEGRWREVWEGEKGQRLVWMVSMDVSWL